MTPEPLPAGAAGPADAVGSSGRRQPAWLAAGRVPRRDQSRGDGLAPQVCWWQLEHSKARERETGRIEQQQRVVVVAGWLLTRAWHGGEGGGLAGVRRGVPQLPRALAGGRAGCLGQPGCGPGPPARLGWAWRGGLRGLASGRDRCGRASGGHGGEGGRERRPAGVRMHDPKGSDLGGLRSEGKRRGRGRRAREKSSPPPSAEAVCRLAAD